MLKTSMLFTDHMVLQREKEIAVWGSAAPGEKIEVILQGKSFSDTADQNGQWLVKAGPFQTALSEEMTVKTDEETLVFKDVAVGEVWLAGGQSNMEFHMRYDADMAEEIKECENPAIRFYDYPEVSYPGQLDEADYLKNYGFWRPCDPENLERFSAVGYYFAKKLQKKYHMPVGIIGCNWGGTTACAWMSEEAIKKGNGDIWISEYAAQTKALDEAAYIRAFEACPSNYKTDLLADDFGDMMMYGIPVKDMPQKAKERGLDFEKLLEGLFEQIGPRYERRPSGLYETMLKQVAPYTIKGVIWYQGESDDAHPEVYRTLFPALIENWRQLWNEQLPFLFVQLAPMEQWEECSGEHYPVIREAQQWTADHVEKTGMAVITDAGMRYDIHPKKKRPAGERLALLAEHIAYGEDVLCEAPRMTGAVKRGTCLEITFENTGEGLVLQGNLAEAVEIRQNGKKKEIAGCRAEDDKVYVELKDIADDGGTEILLAWKAWYQVNLYNSAGLPARPGKLVINAGRM